MAARGTRWLAMGHDEVVSRERFDALVEEALVAPVSGWQFPFLEQRIEREQPSWDYPGTARALLANADTALDHGTGGGEVLANLGVVPHVLIATESFAPNVAVAARCLRPLGAYVVQVHGDTHDSRGPGEDNSVPARRQPFRDCWLDVFLVRNCAFCPADVYRMLRRGGRLLYQGGQVDAPRPGQRSLRDYFHTDYETGWGCWQVRDTVLAAGFEIVDYREQLTRVVYRDIAAVVFALRMSPWTVGPFNIDAHRERLYELHQQIDRNGGLVTSWTSLFLHARKA
jgi:SAM-dependent methyltransferase